MPMSHARTSDNQTQNATRPAAWRLYPLADLPFDPAVFRNPPAIYRGAPFWSWNNKIDVDQLLRHIGHLREMGFGGFHIHSRTGLATPYMGPEFMAAVKACTDHAAALSMHSWLYDEDRWPSGFAGGLVTAERKYRAVYLLWTPQTEQTGGRLLGRYAVALRDGRLSSYTRMSDGRTAPDGAREWRAYLMEEQPDPWFNGQTYVDTMNREAIERFIETTHEPYRAAVGEYFGGVVPAMFTDEPRFRKKQSLAKADDLRDVPMAWSPDFFETFAAAYGQRLEDHLPELFWNLPGDAPSLARYRYHDHTAERFAAAFSDTLSAWCGRQGIALTGHMLSEQTLNGQTRAMGEMMRGLRSFQLPGIDVLSDKIELTTAKQAQSVARQYGRQGVLSELYGVTNWDFDFAGHKRQGDWQAALGVSVRVHHLAWVSMEGEAKRDYPAAISHQSPWFREYPLVEDHFARVNSVMTRGTPAAVSVGVIHPIESIWLAWGPTEHSAAEWDELERGFSDVTAILTHGLIDFDFVSESLLPTQSPWVEGKSLRVGAMAYGVVVVPSMRTIRGTTMDHLERLADAGGTVVFAGGVPTLVDAAASDRPRRLAERCIQVPLTRRPLLGALEPWRQLDAATADGVRPNSLVAQMRQDGQHRLVFACNSDRERGIGPVTLSVRGRWAAALLDTRDGAIKDLPVGHDETHTRIAWDCHAHDHILLRLSPTDVARRDPVATPKARWKEAARLGDPVPVALSEPNVLLLDRAEWLINGGDWQPAEEMLRLDNLIRSKLGLPPRGGRDVQPWVDAAPSPDLATVKLRFHIRSDVSVQTPMLAIEQPQGIAIELNGRPVSLRMAGWWVDESIRTVGLPSLSPGLHELVISRPFSRKSELEWCYLLGDFGVAVAGSHCRLIEPVTTLAFGDWTRQGLPFYAGNVTYHCVVAGEGKPTSVAVDHFKAPLISVELDERPAGKIAFAPYHVDLGVVRGPHALDLTVYGNRHNAFAPIHHTAERLSWVGPGQWRSEGAGWADQYNLKPMGILTSPRVLVEG